MELEVDVAVAEAEATGALEGQLGVAGGLVAMLATHWAARATPPRARGVAATCAIIIWRTSRIQCLFGYCCRDSRLSSSSNSNKINSDYQPPDVIMRVP